MNSNEALTLLKEGNKRFVDGQLQNHKYTEDDKKDLKAGQAPHTVVICCSDSRVSPDILFDQKLGNLFVIRNAGNIIDETALASIEYPIKYLGSKLVVVMGHSDCGAVTAAYENSQLDGYLKPAIDYIKDNMGNPESLETAIDNNTEYMTNKLKKELEKQGLEVKVISDHEDIATGAITFND